MTNQLAERKEQGSTNLAYMDSNQVTAIAEVVKKVASWASKMSDSEIGLSVRRSMSMGVDPLNPSEVQIWKDNRGTINVQLAYPLIIEWVKRFKGAHTNPQYTRLDSEQLKSEGLSEKAVAYRCTFFMNEDLFKMTKLLESDVFSAEEARAMFCVEGLGVSEFKEYSGQYFAPNGRSRSWKVQKRALADAYRRKFGTPTLSELIELRRTLGNEKIQPQDWENTSQLAPGDAVALADARANERQDAEVYENMTDDEKAEVKATNAAAADALWCETPSAIVDIEAEDVEEDEEYTGVPDQLDDYPEIPEDLTRDEAADKCRDLFSALRDSGVVALLSPDFTLLQFYLSSEAMEEALEDLTNGMLAAEVQVYLTARIEQIKNIIEEAE